MKVSVIISYYKALDNLRLILDGLQGQSNMNFEVIISEDDDNPETRTFIKEHSAEYNFPIIHVHQSEDLGFRKTMMLNKSIIASNTPFLIFIDGDCIPEKQFIKAYINSAEEGYIFWGRRVMLGSKYSEQVKQSKSGKNIGLFSLLTSDSSKIKEAIYSPFRPLSFGARGLKGCNWGVAKRHLIEVNGFDEDYIHAGVGEDNDIEWRLEALGLTKSSMKNKAIVYHLHHPRGYSDQVVTNNFKLFQVKQKEGHIKCLNGIQKIELPSDQKNTSNSLSA